MRSLCGGGGGGGTRDAEGGLRGPGLIPRLRCAAWQAPTRPCPSSSLSGLSRIVV